MNVELIRGDTFLMDIEALDNAGAPLPLASGTMWITVKNKLADADSAALMQGVSPDEIVFTDPDNGKASIELTPEMSKDIDIEKEKVVAVYDVQFKNAEGQVFTLLRGNFTIYADVTRET